jgi:hypothetical protein
MDPRPPDGADWAGPAMRNVGLMVLVMGSIVGLGVGAMAAWGAGHPPYQDVVLAPAQQNLAHDRDAIQLAQAAALGGDYGQARFILERVRDGQAAFVRDVLSTTPPQSPTLKDVHAALLALYASLGDGLDAAIQCMDDLLAGHSPLVSTVCIEGQAALARAPQQAQDIADRLAALRQELAS